MRSDDADRSAPAPAPVRKLAEKLFLGPEFVTWLYFTILEEGGHIDVSSAFTDDTPEDDRIIEVQVGKRAQLKSIDASGARVSLAGPGLDDSGEILQAIRRGALLDVLSLEMSIQSRVYAFSLKADDGGLVSVKLPDLFSEPDEDSGPIPHDPLERKRQKRRPKLPLEDVLALRMQCLTELERVLDVLFERFVTRRLARAWRTEDVAGIRKHVALGLKDRLVDV